MDRKYSDPNIWDNSIDYDDAPDGSDGGYTKNGSYIRPPAMRELVHLRAELAEAKRDAERYRWVLEHWDTGGPDFGKIMFSSTAETLSADIDTARKGEGE